MLGAPPVAVRDVRLGRQLRRVLRNTLVALGAVTALVIIASAVFAPAIAPHPPDEQNFDLIESAPSAKALFGTDRFGRDEVEEALLPRGPYAVDVPRDELHVAHSNPRRRRGASVPGISAKTTRLAS